MPKLLKLTVLLFAMLLGTSLVAPCQRYTLRDYGQADGLGDLAVLGLVQDSKGYLWIGTEGGVYRYDGIRFDLFGREHGLSDTFINRLYIDTRQMLWALTPSGAFYFDGKQFHPLLRDGKSIDMDARSSITSMRSGEVVLESGAAVLSAESDSSGSKWTVLPYAARHQGFPADLQAFSLMADGADHLWFGCGDTVCEYSESGAFRRWTTDQGVPADTYISLMRDRHGDMWLHGKAHLLVRRNGTESFVDASEGFSFEPRVPIFAGFAEDRESRLLIAQRRSIQRWNGHRWDTVVDPAHGLPETSLSVIYTDRDGLVWVGTQGRGLLKWLGYGDWEHWTKGEGLTDSSPYAMAEDQKGRLWIGDDSGLAISDESHHTFRPFAEALPKEMRELQSAATAPDGTIWMADISGMLLHIDPETDEYHVQRLPGTGSVSQLVVDHAGKMWIATTDALYTASAIEPTAVISKIESPVLAGRRFDALVEAPDHSMWLGTNNGLFHFDSSGWHQAKLSEAQFGRQFSNLAVDSKGDLWVAGQFGGVAHVRLDGDALKNVDFVRTPTLVSDQIYSIGIDAQGRIWVGTDRGISVLADNRWRKLDQNEGLIWNDLNDKALLMDPDGSVWIGTSGGLSHLVHPEHLMQMQQPTKPTIVSATWGDLDVPLDKPVKLSGRNRDLYVKFAVLSYRNEDAISFRYRLLGFEDNWIETHSHYVRYPKLPPGKYRFELVSEDKATQADSEPVTMSLEVLPPWWQTWTFRIFCGLLLTALGYALWQWRIQRLLDRQRQLESMVASRTRALETERRELLAAREALRLQATRDGLTGLWNRMAILDILDREWKRCAREGMSFAVLLADIDHFKRVNDTYGHLAGDEVLREVANRLQSAVREYDAVGRYGGEEFLIVLSGWDQHGSNERFARLRDSVCGTPIVAAGVKLQVTCSFGAASFSSGDTPIPPHALLASADRALYMAKENGRDRIEFADILEEYRLGD